MDEYCHEYCVETCDPTWGEKVWFWLPRLLIFPIWIPYYLICIRPWRNIGIHTSRW